MNKKGNSSSFPKSACIKTSQFILETTVGSPELFYLNCICFCFRIVSGMCPGVGNVNKFASNSLSHLRTGLFDSAKGYQLTEIKTKK